MIEYCLKICYPNGRAFNSLPYNNFTDVNHLLDCQIETKERGHHLYYVDNDFYNNQYPAGAGVYYCIMQREVTEWQKYSHFTKEKKYTYEKSNILYLNNYFRKNNF